jgi:hypothetical protein
LAQPFADADTHASEPGQTCKLTHGFISREAFGSIGRRKEFTLERDKCVVVKIIY